MADSDGNPSASPEPRPTPPPPARPVAPAPRSNPPNINTGKDKAPPAGGAPGFNEFLEWMRQQSGGETAPADQRTLIPKERKKFQRQDTEAKADKPVAPAAPAAPVAPVAPSTPLPSAEPAAPLPATPVPATAAVAPAPVVSPTPAPVPLIENRPLPESRELPAESPQQRVRRGQPAAAKRNSWLGIGMQLAVLGLLIGSFFLGRASVSKVTSAPSAAPAAPVVTTQDGKTTTNLLSSENAALIDQAMAASQASHFKEATEALEKVKASGERVHGLALQLALMAVFANENARAVPLLNEALSEGDDLAEAYNLRATLGSKRGVFRNAGINDYETASKLAPFESRTFFYWGSALRRAGKSQEAIMRLRQAIDRLREPTAEGYYNLCLRVTQIEVGQEKEFVDELARQLALPHPNLDWLFTAAALALRDGKYNDAAGFLDRAEQCGDPEGFSMRLRDFYFSQFDTRKELARFFVKLPPPKPGSGPTTAPDASPAPEGSAAPMTGLDVPNLPPPASPGATVAR